MSRAGWGVALFAATAMARPVPVGQPRSRSLAEPHLPLRVVVEMHHQKWANCVFASEPLAEAAGASAPVRDQFRAGEPIWARCYFPSAQPLPKLGLVDRFYADRGTQPFWEQAYDQPAPSALSRSLDFSEVLRGVLGRLPPGPHRIRVEGVLRRGDRGTMLYRGEFSYLR